MERYKLKRRRRRERVKLALEVINIHDCQKTELFFLGFVFLNIAWILVTGLKRHSHLICVPKKNRGRGSSHLMLKIGQNWNKLQIIPPMHNKDRHSWL